MTAATVELDWATRVIAHWAAADLRSTDARLGALSIGDHRVEIAEITLTASSTDDATRLAELLSLSPANPDPEVHWQAWSGWVSEASAQYPVLVRVAAPTAGPEGRS
jgi:hypothetical protein